jgi:hypothetical protein
MRMQEGQKDVQRFCRELFRLKAEIACNLFDSNNLSMMTGLNLPSRQQVMMAKQQLQMMQQPPPPQMMPPPMGRPMLPPPQNGGPPPAQPGGPPQPGPPSPGQNGAPVALQPQGGPPAQPPQPQQPPQQLVDLANKVSWEDVLETLKSGVMRSYRIDVETDSTIQGDVQASQNQANMFVQATAQFVQAMGPAVMGGFIKKDVAMDIFSAFARKFKLGRQAEDALSRMSAEATKEALNPPPPQPNPEILKLQAQQKQADQEMQFKAQQAQADMQLRQQQAASDAQLKQQDMQNSAQLEQFKAQVQAQLQTQQQQHDQAMKVAQFNHERALAEYEHNSDLVKMEKEAVSKAHELQHQREMQHSEQEWQALLADGQQAPKKDGKGIKPPAGPPQPSRFDKIVKELAAAIVPHHIQAHVAQEVAKATAKKPKGPRTLIRDHTGKAVGVKSEDGVGVIIRGPDGRAVGIEGA